MTILKVREDYNFLYLFRNEACAVVIAIKSFTSFKELVIVEEPKGKYLIKLLF
jgi:hypothetical protein